MQIQESQRETVASQMLPERRLLERVKDAARSRLTRLSSFEESRVVQCYLFDAGELCGIKFVAGPFQASWRMTDSFIEIKRGQQTIEQLEIVRTKRQAA